MFKFLQKRKPAEKWVLLASDKDGHLWPFEQGEQFHLGGCLTVVDSSSAVLARSLPNGMAEVYHLKDGDLVLNPASGFAPFCILGVAQVFRRLKED